MGNTGFSIETVLDILKAGKSPLILGPPGCGKTSELSPGGIVHTEMAKYHGVSPEEYGHCDIRPCTMDVSDYRGYPFPNKETKTTEFFVPDFLPTSGYGLISIEELMNAPKAHWHAIYQLVEERRIGDYFVPDGWSIAATGNRVEDGCGVSNPPNALINRFMEANYVPDQKDWEAWAVSHGVDYRVIAATRWRPDLIEAYDGKIKGPQSTGRSVAAFARVFENSGVEPSSEKSATGLRIFRQALGALGSDDAGLMSSFLSIFSRLPDVDKIARGMGEDVEIPTAMDVQIATLAQLVRMSCPSNIGGILSWVDRCSPTMKVIFGYDIGQDVFETGARHTEGFTEWRAANSSLFA